MENQSITISRSFAACLRLAEIVGRKLGRKWDSDNHVYWYTREAVNFICRNYDGVKFHQTILYHERDFLFEDNILKLLEIAGPFWEQVSCKEYNNIFSQIALLNFIFRLNSDYRRWYGENEFNNKIEKFLSTNLKQYVFDNNTRNDK